MLPSTIVQANFSIHTSDIFIVLLSRLVVRIAPGITSLYPGNGGGATPTFGRTSAASGCAAAGTQSSEVGPPNGLRLLHDRVRNIEHWNERSPEWMPAQGWRDMSSI